MIKVKNYWVRHPMIFGYFYFFKFYFKLIFLKIKTYWKRMSVSALINKILGLTLLLTGCMALRNSLYLPRLYCSQLEDESLLLLLLSLFSDLWSPSTGSDLIHRDSDSTGPRSTYFHKWPVWFCCRLPWTIIWKSLIYKNTIISRDLVLCSQTQVFSNKI